MSPAFGLSLLVWLMALVALAGIATRAGLWRKGRAARVDWVAGLLAMPKRYLVDVHHIVQRDVCAARMHMLVAGGLLAGSGLAALGIVPGLGGSRAYWALVALAFAVMLTGAGVAGLRRYPRRPTRLSGGRFQILPLLLLGYAAGALMVAAFAALGVPGGFVPLACAAAAGLALAWQTGRGPMRHALAGALHLAVHPRPARFSGSRAVALAPVDLEAERLGVETPADFAWNRLLGFDACVQCGRCEAACPAFAAGQPLNPKRLIQDLVGAMEGSGAGTYSGSPHPHARPAAGTGGTDAPLVGAAAMIHPDTLWSCTTCRACVEECPMMIEHVDAIIDLRRHQTLMLGAVPEKAAIPLDDLRDTDEAGGRALSARADFAAGLDLPVARPGVPVDVLLWLGEGAYDLRYGRTLRALVRLLREAKVDFAILGADERDCGDLARRLGDEATFARLARENVATFSHLRFARILTADPHALNSLRNDYPAFGGHYEVWHHTAFLDALVAEGKLALGALGGLAVTYHDPCYLGRYNGEVDAPRRLLDALGLNRSEMARHGTRAQCCGGGGGAPLSDIEGERRIPDMRMDQARETGAAVVAVACPTCTAMLEGVAGARPEVRDVAELVLAAFEAGQTAPTPRRRALELQR
ncbi:(Fe-S)-binding protein [Roseixanthobacter pseudopolyaromaticivorans]|uniref:(Fe-S)-binding protein n=1 Tax=Xanthobacteraceae TaxID=335928 RepID=UPI00372A7F13